MKDEIIICDCSSAEHQLVLRFDDDKEMVCWLLENNLIKKGGEQ